MSSTRAPATATSTDVTAGPTPEAAAPEIEAPEITAPEIIAPDTVAPGGVAPGAAAPMHLVLVDGSGFIFRAFHALPPMTRADGTHVNAVFGFSNMLARFLQTHTGTHLAVVFDAGRTTFRNRMYEEYKAHRPEPPSELVPQFALVRDATAAFNVPAIELPDWEADDLIASYATAAVAAGGRCTVVSSDKDLMQLVGPGVEMLDPIKQKPIGPAEVMEKFGVAPDKVVECMALTGDSVDNVPGVPGIGPKNASQLVIEYGNLEAILAAAPGMKPSKRRDMLIEHAERARISRRLVVLEREVPLPTPLDQLGVREPDHDRLQSWLTEMGFRSTAVRLGMSTGGVQVPAPAAKPPPPKPDAAPWGPYEPIVTPEALDEWVARAAEAGAVALDVMADGPDPMRARLIGISLATAPGRAAYIPLHHDSRDLVIGRPAQLDEALVIERLRPLMADPAVLKITHNAKADLQHLRRAGLDAVGPVDDAQIISYVQSAGANGQGLDELSVLHLGLAPSTLDTATGTGRNRLPFVHVPLDRATEHAAGNADAAFRLWSALHPRMRENHALAWYEQVERRLVPVLLEMERHGVRVDEAELRRMSADFGERMAVMEEEIHKLAGRPFNLGSTKQLGEILFDEMKLPGGRKSAAGQWGTDVNVLQGLAEQGFELPSRIVDWRQLSKLKVTYADALVEEINPGTGRVHTQFSMAATTTGRISSNDPNLQNIPIRTQEGTRIRRAFIADPGHVLVSCDYSQIELRLLAHVADVPALSEAFATGQDIHTRTASEVFNVPMEGMDGATRRRAKAINFGIIYGISAFGLGRQLGIDAGEAKSYIDAYFARYPGIRAYMEQTREEARISGYVLTPFGRRCYVPGIAERNAQKRAYAERQAINAPLQGGAADVIKRAMVRLPAALHEAGLHRSRLLLQVHDELLFEAPEDEAVALAAVAKRVMEAAVHISVPLVVETGQGHSWAEAH